MVNPPELAIAALGRVRTLPAFAEGTSGPVVPRSYMAFSWGADHRVVDGAALARFAARFKELVEQPERLLLHLK